MSALFVKVPAMWGRNFFRLRKIRSPFSDPQYYADHGFHGPRPHISAGTSYNKNIL